MSVWARRPVTVAVCATALLTLARLALLFAYDTALGPDEAQYWFWGRDFAWGYYSKPPVIGWLIGGTTAAFGDHAWTVRLASPVLIGTAGLFLFGAARRLYGAIPALWTLMLWHLTPAVMLGATIITTDVPLLCCWSAALYALVRMTEPGADRRAWAVGLGAALGLGLMSKYAMIYWPLGLAVGAALSGRARRAGVGPLALAGGITASVFAPNVAWNLANGAQTFGHTADNADWRGGAQWGELGQFVADQFGVAGPLVFAAFLAWLARGPKGEAERMLIGFACVPLAVICAQALLSRAHANWAMTAYPALLIVLPGWLAAGRGRWALRGSAALHGAVGLAFTAVLLHLPLADAVGLSNAVKRLRGWDETAAGVLAAFRAGGHDRLLLDDRELAAHLIWELRDEGVEIAVLDLNGRADNTYERALPYAPRAGERLLLVTRNDVGLAPFAILEPLEPAGDVFVDLNAERFGEPERRLMLYAVGG